MSSVRNRTVTAAESCARMLSANRSMSRLIAIGRDFGVPPADYRHLMAEHEDTARQAQEALRQMDAANDAGSVAA